jgi:hypothetical protein
MLVDFKIDEDKYGYYVIAYRILNGVEIQFDTNNTIAMLINLLPSDYAIFIANEFGSDAEAKNNRMHFQDYDKAVVCMESLRDLIPKAIETGNLHLAE